MLFPGKPGRKKIVPNEPVTGTAGRNPGICTSFITIQHNQMKKIFLLITITLIISGIITGCHKSVTSDPEVSTMDNLKVPAGFSWETSRLVNMAIGIDLLEANIGSLCRISVYDENPERNGNLLVTGASGYAAPFEYALRRLLITSAILLPKPCLKAARALLPIPIAAVQPPRKRYRAIKPIPSTTAPGMSPDRLPAP